MATLNLYCTDNIAAPAGWSLGANTNTGLSIASPVLSHRRLNKLMFDNQGSYDTFNIYVGRYNNRGFSDWNGGASTQGLGNFANNCLAADGSTVSTQTISATFNLLPYDPAQDWHFGDIRMLNSGAGDWIQCYTDSLTNPTGYRLASGGGFTILSDVWASQVPAATTTGYGTLVESFGSGSARIQRVWRGGRANGLSAMDPYAELGESNNILDIGSDETRRWTQLGYRVYDSAGLELDTVTWTVGSLLTLSSRRLYVQCQNNPFTEWGGVTFMTRENQRAHLRIRDIDGWTVSPDLKMMGGAGEPVILDGVRDAIYEAQHLVHGWSVAVVQLQSTTTSRQNQRVQISPFADPCMRIKSFAPVDSASNHSQGGGDTYQFNITSQSIDITFRARATNGRQNVILDPAHAGIGTGTFIGAGQAERVVIEPGLRFVGGGLQYSRAILLNGSPTTMKDFRIGGQVTGMSVPIQLLGAGIVTGMNISNPRRMFDNAPDGASSYTDRWGNVRNWSNGALDGKIRESVGISIGQESATKHASEILITDSNIECLGPGFQFGRALYPVNSPRITVANTVFKPSPDSGQLNIAVEAFQATTNNPGGYMHCINNTALGGIQCATTVVATSTLVAPASFATPTTANGAATNVGWSEYPDEGAYLQEAARAKVA